MVQWTIGDICPSSKVEHNMTNMNAHIIRKLEIMIVKGQCQVLSLTWACH